MIKVVFHNKRSGKVTQVIQYKKQDKLGIIVGATKKRIRGVSIDLDLAEIYDGDNKLIAQVVTGYYTNFAEGICFTSSLDPKGSGKSVEHVAHFANATKTLADALAGTGVTV